MRLQPVLRLTPGLIPLAVFLTLSLAGCGGGGSSPSGLPGGGNTPVPGAGSQDHSYSFGAVTVRSVSNSPLTPITAGASPASGPGVLVTGLAGGSISSLSVATPAASLSQTRIAFASNADANGSTHIYTINPDGTGLFQVTSGNPGSDDYPSWTPDGSTIVFSGQRDGSGYNHLYSVPASGGTPTQLSSGNFNDNYPHVSPDGTQIAFVSTRDGTGYFHVTTIPIGGGATTTITSGAYFDYVPTWSPDGTRIVFFGIGRDGTNSIHLYQVRVAGGAPTALTYGAFDDSGAAWSPVAGKLIFSSRGRDGIAVNHLYSLNVAGYYSPTALTTDSVNDFSPTWSPDGSRIVYSRGNTGPYQLYTANGNGSFPASLFSDPQIDVEHPSWGPFITSRLLVGAGGLLAPSASGVLFGQQNKLVTATLAFTAATPSTAVISQSPQPGGSLPNVVFTINADSLTSLTYANGTSPVALTAIGGSSPVASATGAIVAFDSVDGSVASVIPLTAAGRSASPKPHQEGRVLVYTGSFAGIWDRNGKNIAPAGASEVRLDSTTGKLLGFR